MFSRWRLRNQVIGAMSAVTITNLVIQGTLNWVFFRVLQHLYPAVFMDFDEATATGELPPADVALDRLLNYFDYGILVTTGLFVFISCTWLGWRLARHLSRPIEAVAEVARRIADGDLSARVRIPGRGAGEIEGLITDFNSMATRLERAETDLRYSNSAIAHELKTPLTILRGQLQGLADGVFEPDTGFYREMVESTEDLSRLIDDLRTLAFLSAGKLDLRTEPVDLAELVRSVIRRFDQELSTAGMTLVTELHPACIEADGARMRQAILAVLDNARRYAGGSVVHVTTDIRDGKAVFRCVDSGPGLPEGAQEKVFERFWRADDSRSRASGGTGLGLAIVRAIARAHGGDTQAQSRSGQGTSIEITLPLAPRTSI